MRSYRESRARFYFFMMVFIGVFAPSLSDTSVANILPLSIVIIAFISLITLGIPKQFNPFGVMFLGFLILVLIHGLFGNYSDRTLVISLVRFFVLMSLAISFQRLGIFLHPRVVLDVAPYIVFINLIIFALTSFSETFASIIFALYYNNSGDLQWLSYFSSRFSGTFGNPNTLGITLSFFIPFLTIYANSRKDAAVLLGVLLLIALSLSRTAFALTALTFLLIIISGQFRNRRILFALIFATAISIWLFAGDALGISLLERATNLNLAGREEIWFNAFELITDKAIFFGVGDLTSISDIVDNEYLTILIQFGLMGLLLFLCALGIYFFTGIVSFFGGRKKLGFVLAATTSLIVVASLTASPFTSLKLSFFAVLLPAFLMGLCAAPEAQSKVDPDVQYNRFRFKIGRKDA